MTVRVFKSGFFSAFAHNHEIEVPIVSGEVNEARVPGDPASAEGMRTAAARTGVRDAESSVELRADARKMRVLDPESSADTRMKIQETMLAPQVLDAERFPEIHFKSSTIQAKGADLWMVRGTLDLHGQNHPVAVDVAYKDGLYRGTAVLKQSAFGIKPISIAGGTVYVKDEVRIEFQIALVK